MSSAASTPASFILQSYNVFNNNIAQSPNNILNFLQDYRGKVIDPAQITEQTSQQEFSSQTDKSNSSVETKSSFAVSVGIEGSYSFFSGSVQANYNKETYQSSTAFNFGFGATLRCGSVYFNHSSDVEVIKSYLTSDLLKDLQGINSLASAANFTNHYGTHLVLGVYLGGALYVSIAANTTSESSKTSMDLAVTAQYKSVASVTATAKVTSSLESTYKTDQYHSEVKAIGGSSAVAANMDVNDPKTYAAWAETCTASTVSGVSQSKEFWELATAGSTAQKFLQLYVQLKVLMQSINYPSYFSSTISVLPRQENLVEVTVGQDYKIISGGVSVTAGSPNYLLGCYPSVDQNNTITGWTAASHDHSFPADPGTQTLTSYAIAIYDPGNLLKVKLSSASGTNPGIGGDTATAAIADDYILTGGGAQANWTEGECKFLMQSYPNADVSAKSWTGMIHDYGSAARNVPLTVYAIGVYSEYLSITSQITKQPIYNVQHGNAVAKAVTAIAGGGVKVSDVTGMGNLVQSNAPSSAQTWSEYNSDMEGNVSPGNATAYAIQLSASLRS
ncbi:MAG: MAC/perforin domain-containing protein [Pseudomonadota bacterium]